MVYKSLTLGKIFPMLFITRKIGESIIINNNIELKVIDIQGRSVKIGFEFPKDASVLRKELFDKIKEENMAAASSQDFGNLDDIFGDKK